MYMQKELAVIDDLEDTDPLKKNNPLDDNPNKRRKYQDLWHNVIKNITIEPSLILFSVAYMVTFITTQNLSLEKACRVNLNLTDKICTALRRQEIKGQNQYEAETHKLFALAVARMIYLKASVPGLMSLFVGTWLDKTGHNKIFLVGALIGHCLISASDIIQTYFFDELDINFLILSEAIFYCLGGGWCIFLLSSLSYVSFITNKETRTFRIGVCYFCYRIGNPIGAALGGILLKIFGYYGSYGFNLFIHSISILYITIFVKDPRRTSEHKQHGNQGAWNILRTFFDFSFVKQIISVILKKRPNKSKLRVGLLLCISITIFGPIYITGQLLASEVNRLKEFALASLVAVGVHTFLYMMTRYRFNWDELQYSLFQTYNILVHSIGIVSSLILFSKIWKWHDSLLGILSALSRIVGSILFCFAPNGSIFYIGSLLDMLSELTSLIINSIMSKTVNPDEIGKALSLLTLIENLSPLVFVPLCSKIYITTLKTLPGSMHLVSGAMILPASAVFSWIFYEHRKTLRTAEIRNEVEIPLNS